MDVFTKEKRSEIMSRIRSKNTKLEQDFLKKLSALSYTAGFRYRKHYLKLEGKPDIAFPVKKIAIFIDGCFWHGCPLHSRVPLSNVGYWENKLKRNKTRDKEISKAIRKKGWVVVRIWEHQIKKRPDWAINKIMQALESREV